MKNIYLIIGLLLVLVNSFIGLILTDYQTYNWILSDAIIIVNTLLLQYISRSEINDGFKVSMTLIFPIIGLISFLMSLNLEEKFENNISFIGILILVSLQFVFLIIT